jgi:hypothetical protein
MYGPVLVQRDYSSRPAPPIGRAHCTASAIDFFSREIGH